MDITQSDRDQLREKQHNLNAKFTIGNLVEHRTQDPKQYKKSSITSQESAPNNSTEPEKFEISYKSKFPPKSPAITTIQEEKELEIPISNDEVQANMWLNMDRVEFEKLEWMTSKAENLHREQIKGSTRFDKNGRVIQSKPVKNGDQNDESDGHDLESLVKLLDSTYQPQVIYSLNVITKIASYATLGYYDGAFDENIHQLLLKNCLLRTRHQLDSTNETICQSAIKCLRALLCNSHVDEVLLDRIFPIIEDFSDPNLWLETLEMTSRKFTIEMKDIECVEIDAIKALVERTDLFTRFTHLLSTKTGTLGKGYHECILDILIRIARHSPRLACLINRKELISAVIEICLPVAITIENEDTRPLSTKALKLIRIIAQGIMSLERTRQPFPLHRGASNKLPTSIIPVLTSYMTIDCLGSISDGMNELFKLHLETLRCLKTFSGFRQFKGDVTSIVAMNRDRMCVSFQAFAKLDSSKQLGSKISFDWQYAAHLIDLTGCKNRNDPNHPGESLKSSIWSLFVKPILYRWINDITVEKVVPHLDVSLAMVATFKHFKERLELSYGVELRNNLLNSIVKQKTQNGSRSPNIFKVLARAASQKSQLQNHLRTNGRLRDPINLPSYGWLQFNSTLEQCLQLDPLFDSNSPFFLLDAYVNQLNKWNNDAPEVMNIFLGPDTTRYLRSISGYQKEPLKYETSLQQSFSAQFEVQLIVKTILLMSKCYAILPEAEKCIDITKRPVLTADGTRFENRYEDYGNLCYYAISTIGLLYENDSLNLKDELFRRLLLNEEIQEKVCLENLSRPNGRQLVSFEDGEIHDVCFKSNCQLRVISYIYNCCIPVDRFWIFQPILLFYIHVIKAHGEGQSEKMKNPKWLIENMPWREQAVEIHSSNDAHLISMILNFNYKLMQFSPAYNEFVIRANMEDYICMIGVLFLHDDMFLDEKLSRAMSISIQSILDNSPAGRGDEIKSLFKDASRVIATFDLPLADFFNRLIDQYESVSYGDVAFTNMLLLFMSPYSDKVFKKKLFQEKVDTCVRQLRIGVSDVWSLESVYFSQKEPDEEIRKLYKMALGSVIPGTFLHQFLEFHSTI